MKGKETDTMTAVPDWLAPVIPIVAPFVLGFIVGLILKKAIKIVALVILLLVVLTATGYLSLNIPDLLEKAAAMLPTIFGGISNIIPYSSLSFLLGFGLGLLKG